MNLCGCGRHGHFVLASGAVGSEFCSKEKALEELEKLYSSKSITKIEFGFLKSQISDASRLSPTDEHANMFTRITCEITNIEKSFRDEPEPDNKYIM